MKRLILALATLGVAAVGLTPNAQAASVLINGSFELPGGGSMRQDFAVFAATIPGGGGVPGWTDNNAGGTGAVYLQTFQSSDGMSAQDGTHYTSWGHNGLNGASLSQTFGTVIGQNYTVSYYLGEQQGLDDTPDQYADARIFDSSASLLNHQLTLIATQVGLWTRYSFDFTATTATSTIVFFDATAQCSQNPNACGGNSNWTLDNVSVDGPAVSETPLPAALPLFAGGLGVMGLLARRRKRKAAAALAA